MRNKKVCQPHLRLQILHQIQHLGLNRHVKRRNRFVTDDELWVQGQGSGNSYALPASAI